jgi:hypothetical protein
MGLSAIAICSNALVLLGDSPIASFSASEGKRATQAGNLWPQARDSLLRRHVWACTRKRDVLAADATAPAFDWSYAYSLPGDWIKNIQVGRRNERIDHEIQGGKLLCNQPTLYLVYQFAETDPIQWDDAMVDAAVAEMAARLAYPITQSASFAQLKRAEADQALKIAKALNGQDNPPEDWADSPFVDVR